MTSLIIITAVRFLACKNQIQPKILEFCDLGHQTGSLALYSLRKCRSIKVNNNRIMCQMSMKLKINNNRVMCQMSMKLPAMFDQNPPHNFDKIMKKLITTKNALKA